MSCTQTPLVAPDVNVIRTKVTCLSRKGPRVCTCCPGRRPPSCADVPLSLNPDAYAGTCNCAPSLLGADACAEGVPVYYITQDAKPGKCYSTSFTIIPNAEETLVQNVRAALAAIALQLY